MVNCLLLCVLNDLLIVTCAESSAWSSGSNAFSSIAGVQFLGIPQTIRKVAFVPLTCLGFWDFCSVLLAFRSLAGGGGLFQVLVFFVSPESLPSYLQLFGKVYGCKQAYCHLTKI